MTDWRSNPAIVHRLLTYEAQQNPALRRRLAVLDALDRRSFTPWQGLVQQVEAELGAGIFGTSPQACVWNDIRVLRAAGIAIGYSRMKGIEGYYLRLAMASEDVQTVIRQIARELDVEHLKRLKRVSPDRRVEGVFELIDLAQQISEDGQRARKSGEF
jgi:hypothetical protein